MKNINKIQLWKHIANKNANRKFPKKQPSDKQIINKNIQIMLDTMNKANARNVIVDNELIRANKIIEKIITNNLFQGKST